ncbi:MAG: glutamate-5-semialdehyde dehydrogenase [Ruminococcaceae bacterium]|nr:glutamate-5-semialdehyde dehydrogenase [Oscillospiraceae bacterium]
MTVIETMGKKSKEVARVLATAGALKDKALHSIADALIENTDYILEENAKDLAAGKEAGLTNALLDRLALSPERIKGMADGARQVAALPDPCGRIISGGKLKNGLEVTKVTVPLGVIGIIYEARPNVTADSAVLCLKSGNAVILRGGKEAINSNKAVATVMRKAIEIAGLPADCVQLIEDTTRQSSIELMGLSDYLDVLIPRGGAGLIRATVENAKVPVIETGVGNCHVYVDEYADVDMAAEIIYNAKTSRPSVCNAIETILVHKNIADKALPLIKAKLDEKNVELRGCEKTIEILGDSVKPATDEDYATEYLDYILAVKVVNCINCALNHIAQFSSGHSECIVTENYTNAEKFLNSVDAAAVYVNASTRFTDGGEFGLGAEIGISTQKLHARGPMGINELTSMKFIVKGNGQVR